MKQCAPTQYAKQTYPALPAYLAHAPALHCCYQHCRQWRTTHQIPNTAAWALRQYYSWRPDAHLNPPKPWKKTPSVIIKKSENCNDTDNRKSRADYKIIRLFFYICTSTKSNAHRNAPWLSKSRNKTHKQCKKIRRLAYFYFFKLKTVIKVIQATLKKQNQQTKQGAPRQYSPPTHTPKTSRPPHQNRIFLTPHRTKNCKKPQKSATFCHFWCQSRAIFTIFYTKSIYHIWKTTFCNQKKTTYKQRTPQTTTNTPKH